jgi:hypothetical protein
MMGFQSASLGGRVDRTILKMETANVFETFVTYVQEEWNYFTRRSSKKDKTRQIRYFFTSVMAENKQRNSEYTDKRGRQFTYDAILRHVRVNSCY